MQKKLITKFSKSFHYSKKHIIALGGIVLLAMVIELFSFSFSDKTMDNEYQQFFNKSYKVMSVLIPHNLNFAGERVPITDFSVHEAADREFSINTYWQSQTLLIEKRANRWFPIIEPILKKNNVPEDFKYIALVESQLTNVVSPQGATGFWQMIPATAKNYGLEINDEVDERYNVAKATQAACNYFNEAYKQFNNWTLVAASYNLGMTGVQAQLDKQKVKSYYDLLLTDETARYVFRILAMKSIITNPKSYGFTLRKKDLYPVIPTKKITVDSTIHNLADFALSQKINYKILKLFNPWLRNNALTNADKKKYEIEIPKNGVMVYDMDGNYDGSDVLTPTDSVALFIPKSISKDSTVRN
jgi:hypothetical protein